MVDYSNFAHSKLQKCYAQTKKNSSPVPSSLAMAENARMRSTKQSARGTAPAASSAAPILRPKNPAIRE
jgi:hypothetical protein